MNLNNTHRVSIDFSDEAFNALNEIAEKLCSTKAEVIRKSLGLISFVLEEKENGGRIFIENKKENAKKEIITI